MDNNYFSHNGKVLPSAQATVSLDNIQYSYGFGVYETLRVTQGVVFFIQEHTVRLFGSADIIGLEHQFDAVFIKDSIEELLKVQKTTDCNLKILLIGGRDAQTADLYILVLNPLYPDRKLYRDGAYAVSFRYERYLPHAKTLNMLPSYLAYREARLANAYDALLVNSAGCITEGSRTNFFCIKGKTIVSPLESQFLHGVMRAAVLKIAHENDYLYAEQDILLDDLGHYDGAFLTSTSSKIMPLNSVDNLKFPNMPVALVELRHKLDEFLKNCNGQMNP
jgi:branched-chain amino acid aminotransferase